MMGVGSICLASPSLGAMEVAPVEGTLEQQKDLSEGVELQSG